MSIDVLSHMGPGMLVAVAPLFVSTFTTLLAIINPLEVLPIFLSLTHSKDMGERRKIAFKVSLYALRLTLFFLFFGAFMLRIFGVSLSMVRVAGGIVLTRIGFELFAPSGAGQEPFSTLDPTTVSPS